MKTTIRSLKNIIKEMIGDDIGGPTLEWGDWLTQFEEAVSNAGYDVQSDLPVYDFISSEGSDAEAVDDAIHTMWKEGLDPATAVAMMEDRDAFWEKYITRGSARSRG